MFALSRLANAIASGVENAFRPETSLYEDFIYHWKAIMNFYIEVTDDKIPIDATNLPSHLSQMMQILIQEEATIDSVDAGPCMEYLLQQKVLETLQTLGKGDTPPGMKQQCFIFFTQLLKKINQPLLPHVAVFQPVLKLIKICGDVQASPTEMEEVVFLSIVCARLKEKSHLVNFFITDEQLEAERNKQKAEMEAKAAENILRGTVFNDQKLQITKPKPIDSVGNTKSSVDSSQSSDLSESQRIATPVSIKSVSGESHISDSSKISHQSTCSQISEIKTDTDSSSVGKIRSVSGSGISEISKDSAPSSRNISKDDVIDEKSENPSSKITSVSSKSCKKVPRRVTISESHNTISSVEKISNDSSSISTSKSLGSLNTSSVSSYVTSTDKSTGHTSDTMSDSDDDITSDSSQVRRLAELRVNVLAKTREEQEDARLRLQKYLSRYQSKTHAFDLAESLLNLSKSPDATVCQKAAEALMLLVVLFSKIFEQVYTIKIFGDLR